MDVGENKRWEGAENKHKNFFIHKKCRLSRTFMRSNVLSPCFFSIYIFFSPRVNVEIDKDHDVALKKSE